jgi:sugar phosphate isomerase/epimerase
MERGIIGMALEPTDLITTIEVADEADYDVLELRVDMVVPYLAQGHTVEALVDKFESVPLRPHVLSAIEDIDMPEGPERREMIALYRRMCEVAQAIQCPSIQVVSGAWFADSPWPTIRQETARGLREMAEIGAEYGIFVLYEPLAWMPVRSLEQTLDVIDETDHPNVGPLVDTFQIFAGGGEMETIRGLDPETIFSVHLADTGPKQLDEWADEDRYPMPGEGIVPVRELMAAILSTGYDGVICDEIWSGRYTTWSRLRIAKTLKAKGDAILASLT